MFVVDTHALAWFIAQSSNLSKRAADALRKAERAEVEVLIPTIVLAELLYIAERKRIAIGMEEVLQRIHSGGGFRIIPFDFSVFERMKNLAQSLEIHDRIIVATAELYNAQVITKDAQIKQVVKTLWQ